MLLNNMPLSARTLAAKSKNHGFYTALFCLVLFALSLTTSVGASENNCDDDSMDNAEEHQIAKDFFPPLRMDIDESCGPLMYSNEWCLDGNRGAYFQRVFAGYDVIDMGFSGLKAIEYTLFYDRDCGCHGINPHNFDAEGFTVLVQATGSDYRLRSAQTCAHHKKSSVWGSEMWDRLFNHEVSWFPTQGILISDDKHANYIHDAICEEQLAWGCESCGSNGNWITINNRCVLAPYDPSPCPCCLTDLNSCYSCWDENLSNPSCWLMRLSRAGKYEDGYCHPFDTTGKNPLYSRKHFPPFVPITIGLPENLAYVDIFRQPGFTADAIFLEDDDRENFGSALVSAGMPLRLIAFPNANWWREYYCPRYQLDRRDEGVRGLWSRGHGYRYWRSHNGPEMIRYQEHVRSLKFHGLPGAVLAIYDHEDGVFYFLRNYIIPNGERMFADSSLPDATATMEFISWGFGPMADAGPNQFVVCGNEVRLDARGSYQFALEKKNLNETFNLFPGGANKDEMYENLWDFNWYDETFGDRHLGSDVTVLRNLSCGTHKIRLEVSGRRYPQPNNPAVSKQVTVKDWCTVTVGLTSPKNVMTIPLCGGVEIYWDSDPTIFGYEVWRDGELLVDVGNSTHVIDTVSGTHTYLVYSYNRYGQKCGSETRTVAAKQCDESVPELPRLTALGQNRPNPFNPSTAIDFDLSAESHVKITVYNILGEAVRVLLDENLPAGRQQVIWYGDDDAGVAVPSGIYFYRLETPTFARARKMVLLK